MKPKLFYYCYSHDKPTGGQKHTYRHVDVLNSCGYEAFVLHREKDYRLKWFENSTRVIDSEHFDRIFDAERDYLVLPEDLALKILDFPGRKVIFNKGIYNGFRSFGPAKPYLYPYLNKDVVGVLSVSDHNIDHLRFAYPHLPVLRVCYAIDSQIFRYIPLSEKKRKIAYTPKCEGSLLSLFHILQSRADQGLNSLKEFEWVALKNKTEEDAAATLQESLLFVFLSVEEGLPRTPIEAMACGCLVVGHGSGPLKEVLPFEYQFEYGNIIRVAEFIEHVVAVFVREPCTLGALCAAGHRQAVKYSADQEKKSILNAWEQIFAHQGYSRSNFTAVDH
jgi:glycosyltransferase involved in cell wall biosynthesis